MIEQGVGFSVLTEEFASTFIKDGTLIALDKTMHFEDSVALAWYPRTEMPQYFKELIESITKK